MFKKITAVLLSAVLLVSAATPALAADTSLDEKLSQVTQTVKETLGTGDEYTQFSSDITDNGEYSYFNLYWSNDEKSLDVTADENGKVLSYGEYTNSYYDGDYGYAPIFAKANKNDAQAVAEAFLKKVLGDGETADFSDYTSGYNTSDDAYYLFDGTILLNGLKSPITFSVRIKTEDMSVSSFTRSDCYSHYSGDIPSASASVSAESVAELLKGTVKLKLQYVLSDDGKTAVLQYNPVYTGDYAVNANTGKLVNVNENTDVYDGASYGGGDSSAANLTTKMGGGLTDIEQSTVDSLKGVLSKTRLDADVRAVSGLGIDDGFSLDSASYQMDVQNSQVYCRLQYVEKISDEAAIKARFPEAYSGTDDADATIEPVCIYKDVTVDAATGGLIYVNSYTDSAFDESDSLNAEQLTKKASEFLSKNLTKKFSQSALDEDTSDTENGNFVYTESTNGIPFPTNSISVSINTYDGTVDSLYTDWTDGVTFDSASGIITGSAAKTAYTACFEPVLQYVGVLTGDSTASVYKSVYKSEYELLLAYKYDSEDNVTGIDAKTGETVIAADGDNKTAITYGDLDGVDGKAKIEKLARYGIGFSGGSFLPAAQLTQEDALTLLLSALGYSFDDEDDDSLYKAAYENGFLKSGDRDTDKLLTRAEFVKMLVGATEYGAAAKLNGVFSCGFSDDGSISEEYYGYVAIAKALGIVQGDTNNNFNPDSIITRREAALMLYNFMSR